MPVGSKSSVTGEKGYYYHSQTYYNPEPYYSYGPSYGYAPYRAGIHFHVGGEDEDECPMPTGKIAAMRASRVRAAKATMKARRLAVLTFERTTELRAARWEECLGGNRL